MAAKGKTQRLITFVASVAAVREVVEGVVGPYADNEYAEMTVDGLTPQL